MNLEMARCGTLDFFKGIVASADQKLPDLSKIKINAIGLRYNQLYCVWKDFVAGIAASKLSYFRSLRAIEKHLRSIGAYHWADEVYMLGRRNLRNAFKKNSIGTGGTKRWNCYRAMVCGQVGRWSRFWGYWPLLRFLLLSYEALRHRESPQTASVLKLLAGSRSRCKPCNLLSSSLALAVASVAGEYQSAHSWGHGSARTR